MEKLAYSEAEQSPWVEDYEWVGIVYSQDVKPNVTLITPLAFYDQNESWQTITENERSQGFPNNGKVARFTSGFPKQKVNQLYWFRPERNPQSLLSENITVTDSRYSRYLTYSETTPLFEPLAQIFDWSSRASHLFAVPDLLEQGIPAGNCLSHTIFIHYQNQIYGPLRLEPDFNNPQILKPREYNQKSSSGGQPLLLKGYSFARDKMIILESRPFIDQKNLGSPVSQADWSLPQTTIKRVLQASRNVSTELQEKEHLIKKRINELAALSSSSGPESLHIETCVIQRAQYLIQHQLEHLDSLQAMIEELPEEHPLLEKARALEIQQRKARIEQEVANQCEAERSRLHALQEEVQSAQESLGRLNGEIKEAEQKQEQMSADFTALETSMRNRLAELRQEPLRLLTDLQLISALPLALFQTYAGETTPETGSKVTTTVHDHNYFAEEKVTTLTNPHDLHWVEIAKQNRISTRRVRACAAALLAGLIPVADGPTAFTVLQTIAQGLTGQRLWRVPVSLTALSPLDIFGNIIADQRLFVPAAGNLADILIEAQTHSEQLGLVVLEGADRVPFLPVIEPLLRQYRSLRLQMQRGEKSASFQETLQLFHPRALATDDPYQKISRLAWPANLLLGVTFDHDISSFALPETYDLWFAHIERIETNDPTNSPWSGEQKNWQVSPTSWYAWEKEVASLANGPRVLPSPGDLEPRQQTFYKAMLHFEMQKDLVNVIKQLWPQQ